jgi:hypothetical protein
LYKCWELTFPLVLQKEAHRSNVSGRTTQSRARNEAGSSQQQQPPHSPVVPGGVDSNWAGTRIHIQVQVRLGSTPATTWSWRIRVAECRQHRVGVG